MIDPTKKIIHSYSGGLGSFMASDRMINEWKIPRENIDHVFCDTLIEDEDLYRFLDDSTRKLQVELITLTDGRHPWDVFWDEKYQGNSRVAPCSKLLKTKMFLDYLKKYNPDDIIVSLGMNYEEEHRLINAQNKYKVVVIAPMMGKKWLSHMDVKARVKEMGIKLPRLYEMGFVHNNCGGFCVRAGKKQFKLLYKTFPDRYMYHENKQEEFMRKFAAYKKQQHIEGKITKEDYAKVCPKAQPFLTKMINGKNEYITMKEFREKYIEDTTPDSGDLLAGCGCFIED